MDRVHVYQGADGDWWWRKLPIGGGHQTGASEEGYRSKSYALERASEENPDAEIVVDG